VTWRSALGFCGSYTSRVEAGHTVPSLETIQKYAYAFEIPLYRFFVTDGEPDVHSLRAVPIAKQLPRTSETERRDTAICKSVRKNQG